MVLVQIGCQIQLPHGSFDSVTPAEEMVTNEMSPYCGSRSWEKETGIDQTNSMFSLRFELGHMFTYTVG